MSKSYELKNRKDIKYIKIDRTNEGFQYYLYKEGIREIIDEVTKKINSKRKKKSKYHLYEEYRKLVDGGILENPNLNDYEALKEILKMFNMPIDIEYEELDVEIEETSDLPF